MANYECVSRTNYFHVKDAETFREFMDSVIADDLHLWEEKDNDNNTVFAFGCEELSTVSMTKMMTAVWIFSLQNCRSILLIMMQ